MGEVATVLDRESKPDEFRFWSHVFVTAEPACWPWLASTTPNGYGTAWWGGRLRKAHRVAYELLVGPIPEGLDLDHLCRQRRCVNPAHLEPVTRRENLLRGQGAAARNAAKTECHRGHPFTPENTIINRRNGTRRCRECALASRRAWGRRNKR